MEKNMIMVDAAVVPSVLSGVLEAKELLSTGKVKTASEAARAAGISRSAFYKYKDSVFHLNHMQGTISLFFEVEDIAGLLSEILSVIADFGGNILTINQNIPVNGVASITISLRTKGEGFETKALLDTLSSLSGVRVVRILAREDY